MKKQKQQKQTELTLFPYPSNAHVKWIKPEAETLFRPRIRQRSEDSEELSIISCFCRTVHRTAVKFPIWTSTGNLLENCHLLMENSGKLKATTKAPKRSKNITKTKEKRAQAQTTKTNKKRQKLTGINTKSTATTHTTTANHLPPKSGQYTTLVLKHCDEIHIENSKVMNLAFVDMKKTIPMLLRSSQIVLSSKPKTKSCCCRSSKIRKAPNKR